MSHATVFRFILKKRLRPCSQASLINCKPPCHQTAGEEFKKHLGSHRAEAIPTRIKHLTPISISTSLLDRSQPDQTPIWFLSSAGPVTNWLVMTSSTGIDDSTIRLSGNRYAIAFLLQ